MYNRLKDFGFQLYLECDSFNCDRMIIQLESLGKIEFEESNEIFDTDSFYAQNLEDDLDSYLLEDDENEIRELRTPTYDLIIMDECESLLNHFDSTTFRNNGKVIFNILTKLLGNCKKIINLDGDMGLRTFTFGNEFGKQFSILNKYQNTDKTLQITKNVNQVFNNIV